MALEASMKCQPADEFPWWCHHVRVIRDGPYENEHLDFKPILPIFKHLSRVEELHLSYLYHVKESGIEKVVALLPSLRVLEFGFFLNIDDENTVSRPSLSACNHTCHFDVIIRYRSHSRI